MALTLVNNAVHANPSALDWKHVVLPDDLLTNPAGHTVLSQLHTARYFAVWGNAIAVSVLIFPSSLYQYHPTKDSPCRCSSYCCLSCSWKARMTWDQTASADAWSKQPHLRFGRCQLSRKPFETKPLTLSVLSSLLSVTAWFRMKKGLLKSNL